MIGVEECAIFGAWIWCAAVWHSRYTTGFASWVSAIVALSLTAFLTQ